MISLCQGTAPVSTIDIQFCWPQASKLRSEGTFFLIQNMLTFRNAGDLKLTNFCLSEPRSSGKPIDELLRLIDMGLSQRIRVGNYIYDAFGTLEYLAPEVMNYQFDHKVDMWSLGVILYQLITVCLFCGFDSLQCSAIVDLALPPGVWNTPNSFIIGAFFSI